MQQSHMPDASCPDTSRQSDRNREPATPTRDVFRRPKSQSKTVYHTETKPLSGHWGSRKGPAHHYRVFCRQQAQDAAGQDFSPHPETEASGKHKKYDWKNPWTIWCLQYNSIHKRWDSTVAMAMLPPPPTKPITLPWQCGFSGEGKKEEYAKPRTKGRGVS